MARAVPPVLHLEKIALSQLWHLVRGIKTLNNKEFLQRRSFSTSKICKNNGVVKGDSPKVR
jgi:hypothetical protein